MLILVFVLVLISCASMLLHELPSAVPEVAILISCTVLSSLFLINVLRSLSTRCKGEEKGVAQMIAVFTGLCTFLFLPFAFAGSVENGYALVREGQNVRVETSGFFKWPLTEFQKCELDPRGGTIALTAVSKMDLQDEDGKDRVSAELEFEWQNPNLLVVHHPAEFYRETFQYLADIALHETQVDMRSTLLELDKDAFTRRFKLRLERNLQDRKLELKSCTIGKLIVQREI